MDDMRRVWRLVSDLYLSLGLRVEWDTEGSVRLMFENMFNGSFTHTSHFQQRLLVLEIDGWVEHETVRLMKLVRSLRMKDLIRYNRVK
jgi:hypothetical protein